MANIESIQNSEIKEPQTQNSLKVIDAECIRMSRLVRDMLLLASSDADKWTIHTQEVNIDTLLIMLYEAYEPICRKKSIHLDLNLDVESYPQIYTDQERVFQVLSIFLDNAASNSKEKRKFKRGASGELQQQALPQHPPWPCGQQLLSDVAPPCRSCSCAGSPWSGGGTRGSPRGGGRSRRAAGSGSCTR